MAAAAATAAGVVIAGYLRHRSESNATKAETRANDQAIEYTRQQEERQAYDRREARERYQADHDAWERAYFPELAAQRGNQGAGPAGAGTGFGRGTTRRPGAPGTPGEAAVSLPGPPAGAPPSAHGANLGDLMTSAQPLAAALPQRAMPALQAPVQLAEQQPQPGLGGLADYDWRRKIAQPQVSLMGGRA